MTYEHPYSIAATRAAGYRPNDPAFNAQLSALHMALNDPAGRESAPTRPNPNSTKG